MGTDQYISPAAYEGYYCPASDVFAAGVLFYKLATGKFPFAPEIKVQKFCATQMSATVTSVRPVVAAALMHF